MALRNTQKRARSYCFTLNNPTDEETDMLKDVDCKFIGFGREVAPDTGTPHLQGFITLNNARTLTGMKKIPGFERAHLEVMRGSHQQNMIYISKEDKEPFTKGEVPTPGKRNDIHSVVEKLRDGTSLTDLVQEDNDAAAVFVKYPHGLALLESKLTRDRTKAPSVIWLYGETGVGKTRCVMEFSRDNRLSIWTSNSSLQWFNGYAGDEVALFDDYRPERGTFSFLLRLLDRYPLNVPIKGGFVKWIPEFIFITTPRDPRETWSKRTEEDLRQLERRITHIIEIRSFEPARRGIQSLLQSALDSRNSDEPALRRGTDGLGNDGVGLRPRLTV